MTEASKALQLTRRKTPLPVARPQQLSRRMEKSGVGGEKSFLHRHVLDGSKINCWWCYSNETPDSLEHNERKDEPAVHVFPPVYVSLLKSYRSVY